jgi:hypothetical protein
MIRIIIEVLVITGVVVILSVVISSVWLRR